MSTSKIQWTFEMQDKVSAPAKSAASSTLDLVRAMHSTMAVIDYTTRGLKALGGVILAGIEPAVRQEKALGAFTTMLGDSAKAVDVYAEAVRFANETPFETKDIVDSYKQLLAAQFKADDLQIVTRIVGDASSLQDLPAEAMKSVNRALGQIKSKGKLSQEELNQVAEAVPLNQSMFLENLSKIYGTTLEQTRKLKDAGKISGEAGVYAVLQTLSQQFGGNMERASKQVSGLWSTIASMPDTYLSQLGDTEGYENLRKSLSGIVELLDPMSEKGKETQAWIKEVGSVVLTGAASGITTMVEGILRFKDGVVSTLGPLDNLFLGVNTDSEQFYKTLQVIGEATGFVLRGLIQFGQIVMGVYQGTLKLLTSWAEFQVSVQNWLADIIPGLSKLMDLFAVGIFGSAGGGATGTSTQAVLQQQNFMHRQDYAPIPAPVGEITDVESYAEAMDMPMMADGGIVTRPTIALIGEAGPEQVIPLKDGSGSGGEIYAPINVSIQYMTEGSGKDPHEEDVSAIKLERRINAVLMTALDRWALQMGRRAYS